MKSLEVIILGAGAAGLMCAIESGKRGKSVLVIDHANKPGKKILMSGGGKCNFTNIYTTADNFISHNPHFCKSALSRYTPWDFIELVQKHHIPFHEKTLGQQFCDNKSKDILEMLLAECKAARVNIQLLTDIQSIVKDQQGHFILHTSQGKYLCQSLVIATGGLSIPTMGATPFGYEIAKQFGLKVWPTKAGLVPFTVHEKDKVRLSPLSGISVDCSAQTNGETFKEAMLITHRGLSGPAMLQLSSYWSPGDQIQINLMPNINLFEQLKSAQKGQKTTLKNTLSEYYPKRLISLFLGDDIASQTLQGCSYDTLFSVAKQFQQWEVKPNNTEGYRTAEVTLGGVDCNAISSKTFESKTTQGLYFIGEVLDVTGWLGGYNFQWAWASGFAAGQAV